ncbi:MAG: histidine phosphatase family protein [Candidatus Rokuibacteriota bacterium]
MTASTWVYLIRHGEVEGAAEGRFFGHTDVGLSATGLKQVEALGRQFAPEPIEAVYASDLIRARDSAGPLARSRGVEPLLLPALREVAMGRWEGLTFREIREREPDTLREWLVDPTRVPFPGGENLEDLRARLMPAVEQILSGHAGRRLAVVAHGGSNRVILAEALGMPLTNALRLAQDYACVNLIEYRQTDAVLHRLNHQVAGVPAAAPVEATVRS